MAWDRPELEVWERTAGSPAWTRRVIPRGEVALASPPCVLDVEAVYRDELGRPLVVAPI